MHAPITILYGSITALWVGILGANVSRLRAAKKAFVGDTADAELNRSVRAHGNVTEWATIQILMLLLLELAGAGSIVLHVVGGAIVVCRFEHGAGILAQSSITAVAATLNYLLAIGMPVYALVLRFIH